MSRQEYIEYCRRAGAMLLYWAGFEDENTNPEGIELFLDAIGHSSIPEACHTIVNS